VIACVMSSGGQDKNTGGREAVTSAAASTVTVNASVAVQPSTGGSVLHPGSAIWSDRCFSSPYPATVYTHGSHIYQSGAISGHYIQAQVRATATAVFKAASFCVANSRVEAAPFLV